MVDANEDGAWVRPLNDCTPGRKGFVLYWMQAAHRSEENRALEYAVRAANERNLPLIVGFFLDESYPFASDRNITFLLEGLKAAESSLRVRGIGFGVVPGNPPRGVSRVARDAALVVVDRGYLRIHGAWRRRVAEDVDCPVVEVETNVLVPVAAASQKQEYSAATFRPRIHAQIPSFLEPVQVHDPVRTSTDLTDALLPRRVNLSDIPGVVRGMKIDHAVPPVRTMQGGTAEAHRRLRSFLASGLDLYPEKRNDPSADCGSRLSPYLHFGQISPLTIYHSVQSQESAGAERFLEELIVRRELAINYVTYNPRYDTFRGLPRWAQETLDAHAADHREILYTTDELEAGETHDPYWNAAQHELRCTGAMQSYMRMYWGKKILEWSKTGESAFRLAVALNDRYALDGRDPNGYTGIAWCFGTHDRPWRERPVFGKVRYMNTRGLDRKFRMDAYLDRVRTMCASVSREE